MRGKRAKALRREFREANGRAPDGAAWTYVIRRTLNLGFLREQVFEFQGKVTKRSEKRAAKKSH